MRSIKTCLIAIERYFLGTPNEPIKTIALVDSAEDAWARMQKAPESIVLVVCGLRDNFRRHEFMGKHCVMVLPNHLEMVVPMIEACNKELGTFAVYVQDVAALPSQREHAVHKMARNEAIHTRAFARMLMRLKYMAVNKNLSLFLVRDHEAILGQEKSAFMGRNFPIFDDVGAAIKN